MTYLSNTENVTATSYICNEGSERNHILNAVKRVEHLKIYPDSVRQPGNKAQYGNYLFLHETPSSLITHYQLLGAVSPTKIVMCFPFLLI
jgi:hypothetical protein